MSRLLAPRPMLVVTAFLGLLTTALAVAGELDLALGTTGLALTAMAGLVWSAFRRIQASLTKSDRTEKAMTRLASNFEVSDRRILAAIEALRRDVHNLDHTPPA